MARMLQALKNLEARSPRPKRGVLAHLAADAASPAVTLPATTTPTPAAVEAAPAEEKPLASVAAVLPEPNEPAPPALIRRSDWTSLLKSVEQAPRAVETSPPQVAIAPAAAATPSTSAEPLPVIQRSPVPSAIEQAVLRVLADATQAEPMVQMADRLRTDARQSSSHTLLIVGVGPASATQETLLYAGAALARGGGEVLLIDADQGRRSLSTALGRAEEPGLAELLRSSERPQARCQATAIRGLSLLPAGRLRGTELGAAASRLGEMLHLLASDYALILVDGGRTADRTAATLARLCDATYFVVHLGEVEVAEAQSSLRDFRAGGARVLGCIAT